MQRTLLVCVLLGVSSWQSGCLLVSFFTPDPPPADGGTVDAGPADAGLADAGPNDAGPVDAGPADAGPTDAGVDAGPVDAGPQPCVFDTECGTGWRCVESFCEEAIPCEAMSPYCFDNLVCRADNHCSVEEQEGPDHRLSLMPSTAYQGAMVTVVVDAESDADLMFMQVDVTSLAEPDLFITASINPSSGGTDMGRGKAEISGLPVGPFSVVLFGPNRQTTRAQINGVLVPVEGHTLCRTVLNCPVNGDMCSDELLPDNQTTLGAEGVCMHRPHCGACPTDHLCGIYGTCEPESQFDRMTVTTNREASLLTVDVRVPTAANLALQNVALQITREATDIVATELPEGQFIVNEGGNIRFRYTLPNSTPRGVARFVFTDDEGIVDVVTALIE